MRKALIAVIVASALFAVGALAANFTLTAEDSASGSDAVASCATSATVDFEETFRNSENDWDITTVVVTFTSTPPATCSGRTATLVLQDDDGSETVVYSDSAVVAGDNTATFSPTNVAVAEVWNAAVLIDDDAVDTVIDPA